MSNKNKKDAFQPRIIPNLKSHDESGKFELRLSKAYAPAGHDFTKSFNVIRSAYFFKYRLISLFAIGLYDHLHYLALNDEAFTLDQLAAQFTVGKATLCTWLDELENADLIERVKMCVQKGGDQNLYLIRTPYYEAATLDAASDGGRKRRKRIETAGEQIPELFLESELPRLRQQIKDNAAKNRREHTTPEQRREQKKNWAALFYDLGYNAAFEFENFVFRAYRQLCTRFDNAAAEIAALENMTRNFLKSKGFAVTNKLLERARQIYFYFERLDNPRPASVTIGDNTRRQATTEPKQTRSTIAKTGDAPDGATDERAELRALELKEIQNALASERHRYVIGLRTFETVLTFLQTKLATGFVTFADLEEIAAPGFTKETWQKLATELKQ